MVDYDGQNFMLASSVEVHKDFINDQYGIDVSKVWYPVGAVYDQLYLNF